MKNLILLMISVVVLMTACKGASNQSELSTSSNPDYPVPSNNGNEFYPSPSSFDKVEELLVIPPDSDKATLQGKIKLRTGVILSKTTIYLTPATGEKKDIPPIILIGPEEDSGDIATQTNNQAEFVFNNVSPGSYYLVATSSNSYWIIESDDQSPLLIKLFAGKLTDLGLITVYLP